MREILGFILDISGWFALAMGLLGLFAVLEGRRFARRRRDQDPPELPREMKAVIVVPCRGQPVNFRQHCHALLEQDHPNFELLFVVESEQDAAVGTIRNLMQEYRMTRIGLIVSGPAEHCSQKVHQLRTALAHLPLNAKVVAFADSDLLVKSHWLRWLCGRLEEPGVAAATGGVWAVPRKQSLVNNLYCSMNNALASLFGPKFAPGLWGSWAARVDRLEAARVSQIWASSFSDTWSAQSALCLNGERVLFEPRSIGIRTVQTNWRGVRQSLVRWFKSHRPWNPVASAMLLAGNLMIQVGFWGLLFRGVLGFQSDWVGAALNLVTAGVVYFTSVLTGLIRGQLGKLYAADSRFNRAARRWDCWAWPINSALLVLGDLASRLFNRVRWGDLVYRVDPLGRMIQVGRKRIAPELDAIESEQPEKSWGVVRSPDAAPPHGEAVREPVIRRRAG